MNLVIDVGNTFIKAGIFEGTKPAELHYRLTLDETIKLLKKVQSAHIIISSVKKNIDALKKEAVYTGSFMELSSSLSFPVVNRYKTPQTLGMDRLAAASGAVALYPSDDCLIIDAGTCITYEFVNSRREYFGGAISPGIEMRLKALNTFTEKLPLVQRAENAPLTGGTTEESILSGVLNGILAETEGFIARYRENYPSLKVILCGGDAPFFESKIKGTIFAVPELVLIGLNSILLHNVSKK